MSFIDSYNKIIGNYEKGWNDDPVDMGGETWGGIARNYHPDWIGWKIIDSYKNSPGFPKQLTYDEELQYLIKLFYRDEYWDKFNGDELNDNIACELFDQTINLGLKQGIMNFQKSLNLLNTRNKPNDLYPDIEVDGNFGKQTMISYRDCAFKRGYKLLFNLLNYYQGKYYIEKMEANSKKEKFIGWFNRIEIIK